MSPNNATACRNVAPIEMNSVATLAGNELMAQIWAAITVIRVHQVIQYLSRELLGTVTKHTAEVTIGVEYLTIRTEDRHSNDGLFEGTTKTILALANCCVYAETVLLKP
mmetsp:Transcript_21193/g.36397  ORF Transcript_21193/g.36397 Transcript_21193/m.36397 type:complete len:109 (+) Transcript_21193:351-677(+)